MSDVAIRVEGLGKRYRIGRTRQLHATLRDALSGLARPNQKSKIKNQKSEDFWALRDVSFEVGQGEVLGVIGRNGAGKSTLLKILSRITDPTEGEAVINGRVGSLLEVGTGFHPELTGRENIYLNGAILGMRKAEIARRFDEIVAFSEIEKFLDTPVKRYSSGMYVRLAFAVAAHLESEILLVDEVLAVGDAAFQKKCLSKMGDVAHEGRTVLFVSHNMAAVQALCGRGVILEAGRISHSGTMGQVIARYASLLETTNRESVRSIDIVNVVVNGATGNLHLDPNSPLVAEMRFRTASHLPRCYLNLVIEDSEGRYMVHSRTDVLGLYPGFPTGEHRVVVRAPRFGLRSGVYVLWFRLYVDADNVTRIADSERVLIEVEGPIVAGLVDLPCEWSWNTGWLGSTLTEEAG